MWIYQNNEFTEDLIQDHVAFVYMITNKISGKKYIGKKLFKFKRTTTVKGKRKSKSVDSDWKDYWSSSEEVKKDVQSLGENNFSREILLLCKSKGTASYFEAKYQMLNEVLEKPNEWYNGHIQVRVHRNHIKK